MRKLLCCIVVALLALSCGTMPARRFCMAVEMGRYNCTYRADECHKVGGGLPFRVVCTRDNGEEVIWDSLAYSIEVEYTFGE